MKDPMKVAKAGKVNEGSNEPEPEYWLKQCSCGFNRHHYLVEAVCHYNWWGWMRMALGVTAWPIEVRYMCLQCGEIIEATRDPEVLSQQV